MKQILGLMIGVAHVTAWWFAFWFPFRRRRFSIFLSIPAALFASFYVSLLIIDTTGAVEFSIALPFAIAAINFISYRDRKKRKSEPAASPYRSPSSRPVSRHRSR